MKKETAATTSTASPARLTMPASPATNGLLRSLLGTATFAAAAVALSSLDAADSDDVTCLALGCAAAVGGILALALLGIRRFLALLALLSAWAAVQFDVLPTPVASSLSSFTSFASQGKDSSLDAVPFETRSWYVPMPDGVPLAVDLHTPAPGQTRGQGHGPGQGQGQSASSSSSTSSSSSSSSSASSASYPVILHFTKDVRSWRVRGPLLARLLGPTYNAHTGNVARDLVRAGFAFLSVDVRGTGASFGARRCGASMPDDEELDDLARVLLWAIEQPWCNGQLGVYGVGYDGLLAEQLALTQHPSLKAAALLFSPYDISDEILMRGGVLDADAVNDAAVR